MTGLRYLLLQIRSKTDPMRRQEVACFERALQCGLERIEVFDLLAGVPSADKLNSCDAVLIGGSGDFSAAADNPWLDRTLEGLRQIIATRKPTFASCWGFQAFARAAGGRCVYDPTFAELGTIELQLTEAGRADPLFGHLPPIFEGQAGHEDYVAQLPPGAILLASSATVANQAFKFADAPIYCTQFHPELDKQSLIERVRAYPRYVETIAKMPIEKFMEQCRDTPEARGLLPRFAAQLKAHLAQ